MVASPVLLWHLPMNFEASPVYVAVQVLLILVVAVWYDTRAGWTSWVDNSVKGFDEAHLMEETHVD